MYENGVDEQFYMELTGHRNMDGVIKTTNERCLSNRKNATYFKPGSKNFGKSFTTKGARSSLVP